MKISDYINSKAIAKYLDDLHYNFNASEAAFIVWQSKLSMSKKYKAWEEIAETFPDMYVKARRWGIKSDEPSFLAFLKKYITTRRNGGVFPNSIDPFEGMWFKFSAPFKVGDIVYQGNPLLYKGKDEKQPFVLLNMASWGEKELRENGYTDEKDIAMKEQIFQHHKIEGDLSDMLSAGYFVDEFGRAYREHTISGTYLDLDYYDAELIGEKRILIALSNYLKNKIDIAMLANAYKIIMEETQIEYIKLYTGGAYLDEQLRIAGLK